jgi:hypothetical protein
MIHWLWILSEIYCLVDKFNFIQVELCVMERKLDLFNYGLDVHNFKSNH